MNYSAFLERNGKHFRHAAVRLGDGVVCITGFGALCLTSQVRMLARGHHERKLVEDIGGYGVMHEHCKIDPLVEFVWKVDRWTKRSLVIQYVKDARGHTYICALRSSHNWHAIARTNRPDDAMLMKEFFSTRRAHDREGFGFCASQGGPQRIINYRPDLLDSQTIVNIYGYWLRWAGRKIGGQVLHYGIWYEEVKHGVGTDKLKISSLTDSILRVIIERPRDKETARNVQPAPAVAVTSPAKDSVPPGNSLQERMQWHRDEYDQLASWKVTKLRKDGKVDEALELLQKIIVIVGDKPESLADNYVKLGELQMTLQQHEEASRSFRRALALEPKDRRNWYVAHSHLGACLNAIGQYGEAEQYLRQAIRIEPEWDQAYRDLAAVLSTVGNYVEAAKLMVKAITVSPYYPDDLRYLEDLLEEHEVVYLQVPEMKAEVEKCRELLKRRRGAA